MRSSLKLSALIVVLCLGVLMSGCYGPFNLTKRVHAWNGDFDNEWVQEGVFFVIGGLIYPLAALADSLVFNSIEFWGGDNPIDPPMVMEAVGHELDQVAAVYGLPPELVFSTRTGFVVR